jgi:hypothetical protein
MLEEIAEIIIASAPPKHQADLREIYRLSRSNGLGIAEAIETCYKTFEEAYENSNEQNNSFNGSTYGEEQNGMNI